MFCSIYEAQNVYYSSVNDEELICVVEPPSIEDAFVQASTRPGADPVIQLMHSGMWIAAASVLQLTDFPVTKRNIQLIRDALEKVVGGMPRRSINISRKLTHFQLTPAADH